MTSSHRQFACPTTVVMASSSPRVARCKSWSRAQGVNKVYLFSLFYDFVKKGAFAVWKTFITVYSISNSLQLSQPNKLYSSSKIVHHMNTETQFLSLLNHNLRLSPACLPAAHVLTFLTSNYKFLQRFTSLQLFIFVWECSCIRFFFVLTVICVFTFNLLWDLTFICTFLRPPSMTHWLCQEQ